VVVAPLTWCLVALGQNGSQEKVGEWVEARRWDTVDLIEPAVYLAVAGILLGLIATLRLSPLGPLVGGLLLIAPYVGLFIAPLDVRRAVPDNWDVVDRQLPLLVPLDNGTLPLIGAVLVMAVFSAQRWRRWPSVATAAGAAPSGTAEPAAVPGGPAGSAAPAGSATPAQPAGSATAAKPAETTEPTKPAEPSKPAETAEPAKAASGESSPAAPADEPATVPDTGKEPEKVSVGAESVAEASGKDKSTARGDSSTESPWSAPPGQSRSEKG